MEEKEMVGSLLSAAHWPIVGQICWVLGKVMNFIYTMAHFQVTPVWLVYLLSCIRFLYIP